MGVVEEMGSDLCIITFALYFKIDGMVDRDHVEATYLSQ